jgi:hypothetical protein
MLKKNICRAGRLNKPDTCAVNPGAREDAVSELEGRNGMRCFSFLVRYEFLISEVRVTGRMYISVDAFAVIYKNGTLCFTDE